MRIALDAMGGDYAPAVNVEGAIETISDFDDIDIILVGEEPLIKRELDIKKYPHHRISIKHASQVVKMDDSPSAAIRKKKGFIHKKGTRTCERWRG